jgi:hypothetical protein
MESMSDAHDDKPDAYDHLLEDLEATRRPGNPEIEVTVAVPMSSATLASLTERAAREGRDVTEVVADALRSAAA